MPACSPQIKASNRASHESCVCLLVIVIQPAWTRTRVGGSESARHCLVTSPINVGTARGENARASIRLVRGRQSAANLLI